MKFFEQIVATIAVQTLIDKFFLSFKYVLQLCHFIQEVFYF